MNLIGTWNSSRSGKPVLLVTEQSESVFRGYYYSYGGNVPPAFPFPVVGFLAENGGPRCRLGWIVCWDHNARVYESSITAWAGWVEQDPGPQKGVIDAMWLLSGDPTLDPLRRDDDREWGSIRIGGDAQFVRGSTTPPSVVQEETRTPLKTVNLLGKWKNELNSILTIKTQRGAEFEGTFVSGVGKMAGSHEFSVVGATTLLGHPMISRLAFLVNYSFKDEKEKSGVAMFCGRLVASTSSSSEMPVPYIDTIWMTSFPPDAREEGGLQEPDRGEWRTSRVGRNRFSRC